MVTALETLTSGGRVVISFPESAIPSAEREAFLTFLKAEWVARHSRLCEADAKAMAGEADNSWWQRHREEILSRIGPA